MKNENEIERMFDRAKPEELDSFFAALGEPAPSELPDAVRRAVLAQIAPPAIPRKKKTARTAVLLAACLAVLAAILIAVPLLLRGQNPPPVGPGTEAASGTHPDTQSGDDLFEAVSMHGLFSGSGTALRLNGDRFELYRASDPSSGSSSDALPTEESSDEALRTDLGGGVTLLTGRVRYTYSGPLYASAKVSGIVLDPGGTYEQRFSVSDTGALIAGDGERLTYSDTLPDWVALRRFGGLFSSAEEEKMLFVGASAATWIDLSANAAVTAPYTADTGRSWKDGTVISLADGLSLIPDGGEELYFTWEDGTLTRRGPEGEALAAYVPVFDTAQCGAYLTTDLGRYTVGFIPYSAASGADAGYRSDLPALVSVEPTVSLGEITALTLDRARIPAEMTLTLLDGGGQETSMASPEFVCPTDPGSYLLRIDYALGGSSGARLGLYADLAFTVAEGAEAVDFLYQIRGSGIHATIELTSYTGESGDVVIPASVNGIPVTAVVFETFDKSRITSLSIPDSVTGTLNLTDFPLLSRVNSDVEGRCVVPAGFSFFDAIRSPNIREIVFAPGSACTGVSGIHDMDSLTSVVLPDSVTAPPFLGNCPLLTDVTFGNGIRKVILSVGGCPALARMSIGKNVTEVRVTFSDGQPIPEIFYPCTREVWEKIDVSDRDRLTEHVTFGTIGEAPAGYEPPPTNFAAALLTSDYRFTVLWTDVGRFDGGSFTCAVENPLNAPPDGWKPETHLRIDFAVGEQYGFSDWKPECLAVSVFASPVGDKGETAGPAVPMKVALPLTVTDRGCEIGLAPLSDALAAIGGWDGTIVELILTCNDENSGDNAVRVRFGQY